MLCPACLKSKKTLAVRGTFFVLLASIDPSSLKTLDESISRRGKNTFKLLYVCVGSIIDEKIT